MKLSKLKILRRQGPLQAADTPGGAAAANVVGGTALETLLASRLIGDGEAILMILKPSYWFLILNSATFLAITWVAALGLAILNQRLRDRFYIELGVLVTIGRLSWAALQWMGRLYILTDLRVLRLSGVMTVDVFNCPLRKVARVRMVTPVTEKTVAVGSIEIIPSDEEIPAGIWQTVAKPREVYERLMAAVTRARQSGPGAV
jgi:hypothetical protein